MIEESKNKERFCKICGDFALNANHGVLSCDSCKMFFVRQLSQKSELTCSSSDCEINFYTRRKCAKCRLDKCIRLGMKLRKVEQKNKKSTKKEPKFSSYMDNRTLKNHLFDIHEPIDYNDAFQAKSSTHNDSDFSLTIGKLSDEVFEDMVNMNLMAFNSLNEELKSTGFTSNYINNGMRIDSLRWLTYDEDENFAQISKISSYLFSIPKCVQCFVADDVRNILKFYLWIYMAKKRIGNGMKSLKSYKLFKKEDKYLLMKDSPKLLAFYYFGMMFDLENSELVCKDLSTGSKSELKQSIVDLEKVATNQTKFNDFKEFLYKFPSELRNDPVLMTMIFINIFMNPVTVGLIEARTVKFELITYSEIFNNYLRCKYADEEERNKLIDSIETSLNLANQLEDFESYLNMDVVDQEYNYFHSQMSQLKQFSV